MSRITSFQLWVEQEFLSDMGDDIERVSDEEIEFYLAVMTDSYKDEYQMVLDSAATDWFDTDDLVQMRRDMESVDDYLDSKIYEQFKIMIRSTILDIEEYREEVV